MSFHSNPDSNGAHLSRCPALWSAGPCEVISSKTSLRIIPQSVLGSPGGLGEVKTSAEAVRRSLVTQNTQPGQSLLPMLPLYPALPTHKALESLLV